MTAGRLGSFRSGDRSEYFAAYILSRISYVTPVPRQEDFGVVDFLCVLARLEGKHVLPESAFYVQVKSNRDPIVFEGVATAWMADHMAHPLFICIVEKDAARFSIYSCAPLWAAIFRSRVPPTRIRISFDGEPGARPKHDESLEYDANLGPPMLTQTIAEIETAPQLAYEVLRDWIAFDARNVAFRNIGRVVSRNVSTWAPNTLLTSAPIQSAYWFGPDYALVERDLAPLLIALAHNYRHAKQREKLDRLAAFLAQMRPFLDDHGRDCADGKWSIE